MKIDTIDLSVDRSTRPQVAEASKSSGFRFAQILRCDSSAAIHIDGAASEAVPAYVGQVFEGFSGLWVSNSPYGGLLEIGYFNNAPNSSPLGFPHVQLIASDSNVAADSNVVFMNDPTLSIVISKIVGTYSAAPAGGNIAGTLRDISGAILSCFNYPIGAELTKEIDFDPPLILPEPPLSNLGIVLGNGGAGIRGTLLVYGYKLQK